MKFTEIFESLDDFCNAIDAGFNKYSNIAYDQDFLGITYNTLLNYFDDEETLFSDDCSLTKVRDSFVRTFYQNIYLQKSYQLMKEIYTKNYADFVKAGLITGTQSGSNFNSQAQTPTTISEEDMAAFVDSYSNIQAKNEYDNTNSSNTNFNLFELLKKLAQMKYDIHERIIFAYSKYFTFVCEYTGDYD